MAANFHARIPSARPVKAAPMPAYVPTAPTSALAIKSDLMAAVTEGPVFVKEKYSQLPPLSATHGRSGGMANDPDAISGRYGRGVLASRGYAGYHFGTVADPMPSVYGPGKYPQMTVGAEDKHTGGAVTAVRDALKAIAYEGRDAGKIGTGPAFDANLKAEVEKFQKWAKIDVDGIVGPQTYKALSDSLTAANSVLKGNLVGAPPSQKDEVIVAGGVSQPKAEIAGAKKFYQQSWFPYAAAGGIVAVVAGVIFLPSLLKGKSA